MLLIFPPIKSAEVTVSPKWAPSTKHQGKKPKKTVASSNRFFWKSPLRDTRVWWRTEDAGNYRVLLLSYLAIWELHQLPRKKEKTQEGKKRFLPIASHKLGTWHCAGNTLSFVWHCNVSLLFPVLKPLTRVLLLLPLPVCWKYLFVISSPDWRRLNSILLTVEQVKGKMMRGFQSKHINWLFRQEKDPEKLPPSSYALLKTSPLRNDCHLYQGAFIFKQIKSGLLCIKSLGQGYCRFFFWLKASPYCVQKFVEILYLWCIVFCEFLLQGSINLILSLI